MDFSWQLILAIMKFSSSSFDILDYLRLFHWTRKSDSFVDYFRRGEGSASWDPTALGTQAIGWS